MKKDLLERYSELFTSSKGRFLSILILMMLGSLALGGSGRSQYAQSSNGLLERTANHGLGWRTMVWIGGSERVGSDQRELMSRQLSVGVTVDEELSSILRYQRIFQTSVTSGRLPKKRRKKLPWQFLVKNRSARRLIWPKKAGSRSVLKNKTYKVVEFVNSAAELLSDRRANATSGSEYLPVVS